MELHKIFWDIDETLIHSRLNKTKGQVWTSFSFKHDNQVHNMVTRIRPCALELINFSRDLVGEDNVHILTTSVFPYAQAISKLGGWGFKDKDIFARDTIDHYTIKMPAMYGYDKYTSKHEYANKNNVLIDNLHPETNMSKICLMDVSLPNGYLHVKDYYGLDDSDEQFKEQVKHFLTSR